MLFAQSLSVIAPRTITRHSLDSTTEVDVGGGVGVQVTVGVAVGGVPVTVGVAVGGVPVTVGVRVGVRVSVQVDVDVSVRVGV